jgi:hypothetical protein
MGPNCSARTPLLPFPEHTPLEKPSETLSYLHPHLHQLLLLLPLYLILLLLFVSAALPPTL